MPSEAFATTEDLMRFKGSEELPDNAPFLLDRANDLVEAMIRPNYNPNNDWHRKAARNAVCAQVSYWINTGTSPDDDSSFGSYTLGDLSVSGRSSGSDGGSKPYALSPLALSYLRSECLLYKGVVRG